MAAGVGARDVGRTSCLPAVSLGAALAAILARMMRATLLEELREQYVLAARARGASRTRAVLRHAFRNSLIPVVTIIGLQFGAVAHRCRDHRNRLRVARHRAPADPVDRVPRLPAGARAASC
jgi:hypothetical protein